MDRKGFLGLLGLGAVGAALPKVVEADEAPVGGSWWGAGHVTNEVDYSDVVPEGSWWKEGDWTVVRVPTFVRPDEAFEPHLLVPGCPAAFCVGTHGCVVVAGGVEQPSVVEADTGADRVSVYVPSVDAIAGVDGPFAVMWPDQFVALLSAGWDGPLPLKYSTGPVTGVELPRRRGHMTLGWRSIGVENIGVEDLNFAP